VKPPSQDELAAIAIALRLRSVTTPQQPSRWRRSIPLRGGDLRRKKRR
jgi:hypothetical protein